MLAGYVARRAMACVVRMLPAAAHERGQDRIGVLGGAGKSPPPIYMSQFPGLLRDQRTGAASGEPRRAPEVGPQEEAVKDP